MNEIIKGMSYQSYASRVEYINSGKLKAVCSEPLSKVKAMIDGRLEFESEAMAFGTHFHSMVLEGVENFVVQPKEYIFGKPWHNGASFCKEWVAKQTKPIVTEAQVENLRGMCASIRSHPELKGLLCGQCELSIFVDKKGPKLKARIDLLPDRPGAPVIDFKKARSAKPEAFTRQLFDLQYGLSAALYLDVLSAVDIHRDEFWFVAVEEFPPYDIGICKLYDRPVSVVEYGRHQYRSAYRKLMQAMQTNSWPSYKSYEPEEFLTPWQMQAMEVLG